MTTSIDSNVLATLWDKDDEANIPVRNRLDELDLISSLIVSGPVYGELYGAPGRTSEELDRFFTRMGIGIEWEMGESVWRVAGEAFRGYNQRRTSGKSGPPKKLLTDFIIGAHAMVHGYDVFTLDNRHFRAAFPQLRLVRP
jgi:predicted nucleic acid-binding protein